MNRYFYKRISVMLLLLLAISFAGCKNQYSNKQSGSDMQHTCIIPQSLFGGKTAEDFIEEIKDPSITFLLKSGDEVPVSEMISDAQLNDDGTVTMFFTEEQLNNYRTFLYDTATLYTYMKTYPETSIKSTEFSNDELTDIIIYVDSNTYENSGMDGMFANGYTTTYMGLYQVTGGVDPYEWRVHVTVKDYETGDIITEDYYPNDR